jgi:hypothetical protein
VKETFAHNPDTIALVRQKQIKETFTLIGRLIPGDGHNIYEFNKKTLDLTEVTPQSQDLNYENAKKGILAANKKIKAQPHCIYFSALNLTNAIKHVNRLYPKKIFFIA